jgi:dihydrolipoamide dehydrogenase
MAQALRDVGIELIEGAGPATFRDPHTVALPDGRTWQADRIIIVAGGHALRLPLPGAELGLTYNDIWTLDRLPARVTVVGSAATGCQLASILEDFGSQVTLIEWAPRLIANEDEALSTALAAAFRDQSIEVITGAETEHMERHADQAGAAIELRFRTATGDAATLTTDAVFFAVGWPGNVDSLALDAAGVAVERTYVAANDYLQTSVPHIFATGDINGHSMLVQTARYEGRIAAENAVLGPIGAAHTTLCPAAASPTPNTPASVSPSNKHARTMTARWRSSSMAICCAPWQMGIPRAFAS